MLKRRTVYLISINFILLVREIFLPLRRNFDNGGLIEPTASTVNRHYEEYFTHE